MDEHTFKHTDGCTYKVGRLTRTSPVFLYRVEDMGNRDVLIEETSCVGRELLRVAEDLDLYKERYTKAEDLTSVVRAQRQEQVQLVTELTAENRKLREELDAAKLDAETGQEIIAELAAAIAVLAGEPLKPCSDHDGKCSGHLGPQAADAANAALAAYRALQAGNRQAVERVREVELLLDTVRERQADSPDARVGRELVTILDPHCQGGESYGDALRRIIRERDVDKKRAGDNWALYREAAQRAERRRENLIKALQQREAVESENRSKCLELAEKASEIRELRELLDDQERATRRAEGGRARKLLALLDSEEPPEGLVDAMLRRAGGIGTSTAAWRWLREQVTVGKEE